MARSHDGATAPPVQSSHPVMHVLTKQPTGGVSCLPHVARSHDGATAQPVHLGLHAINVPTKHRTGGVNYLPHVARSHVGVRTHIVYRGHRVLLAVSQKPCTGLDTIVIN